MSYGSDLNVQYRRAAVYVDKIKTRTLTARSESVRSWVESVERRLGCADMRFAAWRCSCS
jgi:hypothetical protein